MGRQTMVNRLVAAVHLLRAQRGVEALELFLRQGGGDAVGHIQARERRGRVDTAVLAVDEPLPTDLLEVRELQIGPGFDPLGKVLWCSRDTGT